MNVGKSNVMKCTRKDLDRRMEVKLNEVQEKVKSFNYLGTIIVANEVAKTEVSYRVNEG